MDKVIVNATSNITEEKLYTEKVIKDLQAENERLKEEINRNGREWENHCNALYWQMQSIIDKYKQALQEIRDIAEKMYYTNDEDTERDLHIELQDKINEVIGAEE